MRKSLPISSANPCRLILPTRLFSTSIRHLAVPGAHLNRKSKPLPPLAPVPEKDLIETFLKGSGPGGQKINKTSSAVQLTHIPTGIVLKSQETRSRSQNRKICRRLLAERLDLLEKGDESRVKIREEKVRKRKERKRKKTRKKYGGRAKKVQAGGGVEGDEEEGELEGEDDTEEEERGRNAVERGEGLKGK